jgi:hypothetical protein
MSTLTKTVNNATVFYDSTYTQRWYDAIGPDVAKYLQEFVNLPVDDTTGDPVEFVNTITEVGGASTAVLTDAAGGALLITCAGNENDGYRMQLGGAGGGECVKLEGSYPLYCGIKFQVNDADQVDFLFGVAVTDTDILGAVTDGMYFRSVDEDAEMMFVVEKDSAETAIEVATLGDATDITAEFLFDGSVVRAYADGVEMASIRSTAPNFPDDMEMRLSLEFLAGAAVASTLTVSWMRMIHLRG